MCERCTQMTTTLSGLQSLASKEGYKHSFVEEIHKSADRGCPLCIVLRDTLRLNYNHHIKGQIRIFPRSPMTQYVARAYRRIFPRDPISTQYTVPDWVIQSGSQGHPFEIAKLTELRTVVCDANVNAERENWKVGFGSKLLPFTSAGMCFRGY